MVTAPAGRLIEVASRLPVDRLHQFGRDLRPLLRRTYRPHVVARNLRYAFPQGDAEALVQDFYTAFSEVSMEVMRALSMPREELRERVTFEGEGALNDGRALLLLAHHGNLVWSLVALAGEIAPPISVVYKPPHLPAMGDLLVSIAERFGVETVPVKAMRRQLVAQRQQRRVWTLVADQRPGRDRRMVRLCGRETAFFTGPERVAKALKWPVYYLSCERLAPARYHCRIVQIAEPPYGDRAEVIERYAACVQADIDRAPADWLWSHDRWRAERRGQ